MDAELRVTNSAGGVKADGGKPRPTLLMASMPHTVSAVVRVLTMGANKYSDDNWKRVEANRYWDALYRHLLALHAGEKLDKESGEHHAAHAITNLLFILGLEVDSETR